MNFHRFSLPHSVVCERAEERDDGMFIKYRRVMTASVNQMLRMIICLQTASVNNSNTDPKATLFGSVNELVIVEEFRSTSCYLPGSGENFSSSLGYVLTRQSQINRARWLASERVSGHPSPRILISASWSKINLAFRRLLASYSGREQPQETNSSARSASFEGNFRFLVRARLTCRLEYKFNIDRFSCDFDVLASPLLLINYVLADEKLSMRSCWGVRKSVRHESLFSDTTNASLSRIFSPLRNQSSGYSKPSRCRSRLNCRERA